MREHGVGEDRQQLYRKATEVLSSKTSEDRRERKKGLVSLLLWICDWATQQIIAESSSLEKKWLLHLTPESQKIIQGKKMIQATSKLI